MLERGRNPLKGTPVFDYTAYTFYGVPIDRDRCESGAGACLLRHHYDWMLLDGTLQTRCPNVKYLIAGPHNEQSFFLVTFCAVADLGAETTFQVDQGYYSIQKQEKSWNRELARAASVLGWSEHVRAEPSWRVILD